jgi:flagellar basal body rod protein FlgF
VIDRIKLVAPQLDAMRKGQDGLFRLRAASPPTPTRRSA